MKTTNKIILMTILLSVSLGIYAQSPLWLVGSNYYDQNLVPLFLPTPAGPSGLDYTGQQAQYAANAWHNPQTGALLFFVVDGVVYDSEGYYLGSLDEYNTPVNNDKMRGISEISIVPDPGDCKRFYIIGGKRKPTTVNPVLPPGAVGVPANEVNSELFYGVVNLALPRDNFNTNRIGSLELLDDNFNSGYILPLKALVPTNQKYNDVSNWSGLDFIAISPKNNDQHFLFYQDKFGLIYTFRISQTGIQYINNSVVDTRTGIAPSFSSPNQYIEHVSRAELEVITMSNGNYRVVGTSYNPVFNNVNNSIQPAQKVYRLDFSIQGSPLISSFTQYQHHSNNSTGQTLIRSIEISPNKNFVYFTSINNNIFERSIYCLDMQTFNLVPLPGISDAATLPFKHSLIERANNGTAEGFLLIAKEDGAYRILNPNTPSTAALSASSVIPVNLQKSRMNYPNNPWWDDRVGLYLLPDQMDFDPNCQVGCNTFACGSSYRSASIPGDDAAAEECCHFYSNLPGPGHTKPIFENITVSSSATWSPGSVISGVTIPANGQFRVTGNITIMPGVSLTMNNLFIEFSPTSKIVVSRGSTAASTGARLTTNNTTLTASNTCGECYMWLGIEAQGYSSTAQSSIGQSRVSITNNSLIEYAHFGVATARILSIGMLDPLTLTNRGGARITSNRSKFLNNKFDVFFTRYMNHSNLSSFSFCEFITDENLKSDIVTNPVHINIRENKGIEIRACRFENETPINETNLTRGIGVKTLNSNFLVATFPGQTPSKFNKLQFGIQTSASNSGLFYGVYSSEFNDNFYGIHSRGERNNIVRQNTFNVFNSVIFLSPLPETFGVYLEACNKYTVTKNVFNCANQVGSGEQVFGCVVDNSGPFPNVINDNDFTYLHTGGVTRRQNAAYTGQKPGGLQWLCNRFDSDYQYDLWMQTNSNLNPTQGSAAIVGGQIVLNPAGNVFYSTNNPDRHIHMEATVPPITYFAHPGPGGIPIVSSNVGVFTSQQIPACVPMQNLAPNLRAERLTLFQEKNDITRTIDYGNTDSLILAILDEYLTSEQRRNLMMNEQISISDDVLIKYIETDPSHSNLYQVLVYNSPLTQSAIRYMMEVSSLPNGMKQQVLLLQMGISELEAKQHAAQDYDLRIHFLETLYTEMILTDSTIVNPLQEIINMYEETPEMNFEIQESLFNLYLTTHNIQKSDSINAILKGIVNDSYYAYMNDLAVASLTSDYYTILQDSSVVLMLEEIAELYDYRDASRAQALLTHFLGYEFEPVTIMGPRNMSYPKYSYDGSTLETVSIFPNPAQDHFFIVFDENADVSQTREVKVYDLSGVLQFTREMKANDYVLEVKTENMAEGMYLVVISADGKEISTQKVAVR